MRRYRALSLLRDARGVVRARMTRRALAAAALACRRDRSPLRYGRSLGAPRRQNPARGLRRQARAAVVSTARSGQSSPATGTAPVRLPSLPARPESSENELCFDPRGGLVEAVDRLGPSGSTRPSVPIPGIGDPADRTRSTVSCAGRRESVAARLERGRRQQCGSQLPSDASSRLAQTFWPRTHSRAVIAVKTSSGSSLAALAWTHVAYPAFAALLARAAPAAGARSDDVEPTVAVIIAAYNEEAVDRAPDREPARARLPGRQAADRRLVRRVHRPHRGDRRCSTRASQVISQPARRQGRRAGPRGAADRRRDRRLLRRELHLGAGRAAQARALVRRPRRRLRLRAAAHPRRRRLEPGGRLLALRDAAARRPSRGSARSPAATARSTRVRRARLRRGRPALRPRPVAART